MNWMPEKIETIATSEYAWSSGTWTDILTLNFDCDSKMLCLIFTGCMFQPIPDYQMSWRVQLDDVTLDTAFQINGDIFYIHQGHHYVEIVDKGSHTLKIQMIRDTGTGTIKVFARRLSIIKGFYQGGTT